MILIIDGYINILENDKVKKGREKIEWHENFFSSKINNNNNCVNACTAKENFMDEREEEEIYTYQITDVIANGLLNQNIGQCFKIFNKTWIWFFDGLFLDKQRK